MIAPSTTRFAKCGKPNGFCRKDMSKESFFTVNEKNKKYYKPNNREYDDAAVRRY